MMLIRKNRNKLVKQQANYSFFSSSGDLYCYFILLPFVAMFLNSEILATCVYKCIFEN